MKQHYITIFLLSAVLLCLSSAVVAQQPTKKQKNDKLGVDPTVEIVTDYQGKLLETDKIDMEYNQTDSIIYPVIRFNYPPILRTMTSRFSLESIPAASAETAISEAKSGYGYLRAGFSYPVLPEADLYLHRSLSKKSTLSAYVNHRSFWGRLPLYEQAPLSTIPSDILANTSKTTLGVALQHIWKKAAIDISAAYKYHSLLFYGQDTLTLAQNNVYAEAIKDNSTMHRYYAQSFNTIKADARIYSLDGPKSAVSFSTRIYYDYIKETAHLANKKATGQHLVGFTGFLDTKVTQQHTLGLHVHGEIYTANNLASQHASGIFNLVPMYMYKGEIVKMSAGFGIEGIYEGKSLDYNIYPHLTFQCITLDGLLTPFLEVSGNSTLHNYAKVAAENPYILPGLNVENSRNRINAELGIKGSFSTVLTYRLKASYAMIDHMHFFVNSTRPLFTDGVVTPGTLRSNFEVVYDDITKAALGFEFGTSLKDFEALLSAQYVQYNMDKEAEAWHQPAFESALQLRYKWDPVIFVLDAFYRGKTPVLLPAAYAVQSTSTGNMINIGLTVEYRVTKTLSFFLQGTNLLNRNEQQYYLYYTPGITVGGGLTCSF